MGKKIKSSCHEMGNRINASPLFANLVSPLSHFTAFHFAPHILIEKSLRFNPVMIHRALRGGPNHSITFQLSARYATTCISL